MEEAEMGEEGREGVGRLPFSGGSKRAGAENWGPNHLGLRSAQAGIRAGQTCPGVSSLDTDAGPLEQATVIWFVCY